MAKLKHSSIISGLLISDDLFEKEEITLVGGDYNVAPHKIDVHEDYATEDKIGFHIDERVCYTSFGDAFRITNPESKEFSWWDYRMAAK